MAILNKTERVIFVTADRELDTLMLETYPGIIKEHQHCTEIINGRKVYVFKDLQLDELISFLKDNKNYEYFTI